MLHQRSPTEICVLLIDEDREVNLTRTHRMFPLPPYFWGFSPLAFSVHLNIDPEQNSFPIDSVKNVEIFATQKINYVRFQIGYKTFRGIPEFPAPLKRCENTKWPNKIKEDTEQLENSKKTQSEPENTTKIKPESKIEVEKSSPPKGIAARVQKSSLDQAKKLCQNAKKEDEVVLNNEVVKILQPFKNLIDKNGAQELSPDKYVQVQIIDAKNPLSLKLKLGDKIIKASLHDLLILNNAQNEQGTLGPNYLCK